MNVKRLFALALALLLVFAEIPTAMATEAYQEEIDVYARYHASGYDNVYTAKISSLKSATVKAQGFTFSLSGGSLLSTTELVVHQITSGTDGYGWFADCMEAYGGKIAPFDIYARNGGKRISLSRSVSATVTLPEGYEKPALYRLDNGGTVSRISLTSKGKSYSFTVSQNGYYVFVDTADLVETEQPVRYTIKAEAEKGGTISPAGSCLVSAGVDQTFQITAEDGYKISNVNVDGKNIGEVNSHTFENVQDDHTITVSFERTEVNVGTIIEDIVDWLVGIWDWL